MFVLLTPIVFLFHVCCCDKNVRIKELRKKRFTLSQSSRLQCLTTKKSRILKLLVTSLPRSRAQKDKHVCAQLCSAFLPLYS